MAEVKSATVKSIAREIYGYDMSDDAAQAAARVAGAIAAGAEGLAALAPGVADTSFSYPMLIAEASRLRGR